VCSCLPSTSFFSPPTICCQPPLFSCPLAALYQRAAGPALPQILSSPTTVVMVAMTAGAVHGDREK